MADTRPLCDPDLLELIPDPETVRVCLAESVRRSNLLRSLLRVARRKASYKRPAAAREKEAAPCS